MSQSLCETCEQMRAVISGTGSRFLLCLVSQSDAGFPKYPPQPVVTCVGFRRTNTEHDAVTQDPPKPRALCLDQFLKLSSIVDSGGQAKVMIQGGQVKVNGEIETRRRRKLVADDLIEIAGDKWLVKDFVPSI